MEAPFRDYVLGLDLGPNSVGWALVAADFSDGEPAPVGFLDTAAAGHPPLGVRVFEAGLANLDTSKEMSLNQDRRGARSMRRVHARRGARRKAMRNALTGVGLLPPPGPLFDAVMALDPYELRARGLDHALAPHELGRALYHLCQRRGFKSNRKSGSAAEDKGILLEMNELQQAIEASGARTLGEYLHRLGGKGDRRPLERGEQRLRGRHTRRAMYEDEFDLLIETQRPFHQDALAEDVVKAARRAIFFQHPFELTEERRERAPSRANLHRAPQLKHCPLEPDERCCPRGSWVGERFRVLAEVNNLRIREHHDPRGRELLPGERAIVLEVLSESAKVTFDRLRRLLKASLTDPMALFNLEEGARKHLDGIRVDAALCSAFDKSAWKAVPENARAALRAALEDAEDDDALRDTLLGAGIAEPKIDKLLAFRPPAGYLSYSRKAIERLLPYLEEGRMVSEATARAYPDRVESARFERLPALDSDELPQRLRTITNPLVRRALVETRKVVHAIIREHGLPRRILVEMARDLKMGAEDRKEASRNNRKRADERDRARTDCMPFGGNPDSRDDVLRMLLWRMQAGECPYTGRPIPQSAIFGGELDIDHILPRWRSGDDSQANKVLVYRSANAEKGDRTPAEWLGFGSEAHRQLVKRMERMAARREDGPSLPFGSVSRARQETLDTEAFTLRQLNDTRYISRAVRDYLSLLYPAELREGERSVLATRGGLTAELRRHWGLNGLVGSGADEKVRDDHRHHAVDALVVALSSRKLLKRFQDQVQRRDKGVAASDAGFAPPWPQLRMEAAVHLVDVNPSHRPMRKVRGPLHEETFHGRAREGRMTLEGKAVTRKRVADLKAKSLEAVRDPAVRRILRDHAMTRGWDGVGELPKNWHDPAPTMASGIPIRRVRLLASLKNPVVLGDRGHRLAVSGNNHHFALYMTPEGKPRAVVASLMDARARLLAGRAPVAECLDEGGELALAVCRKDSVLAKDEFGEDRLCVVQKFSGADGGMDVYLRDARDARPASEGNRTPFARLTSVKRWQERQVRKVEVDPLGRIRPASTPKSAQV